MNLAKVNAIGAQYGMRHTETAMRMPTATEPG